MSTLSMFKVGMIMDRGGKTFVVVAAMNRAHAISVAKQQNPGWHCTGEIEAL